MKRKLNLDRQEIRSEEIAKGRDFKAVLEKLKAKPPTKPLYKNGWFLSGVAGLALVATTLLVMNYKNASEQEGKYASEQEGKYASEQVSRYSGEQVGGVNKDTRFIRPPFEEVQIPFESYTIKMGKEAKIKTQKGSVLRFPKGTLKDEHGNVVKGEVEVRVREFHDPVDFFLSGIPMTYDSAGTQYHFESAGMIEVYAFQGGKVLKIDPEKPVKVELVTNDPEGNYNVYQLDTTERIWVYNGKDQVKADKKSAKPELKDSLLMEPFAVFSLSDYENQIGMINSEIQLVQKDIIQLENTKPLEPRRSTPGRFTCNIEGNQKEFPELQAYKDVLWEVLPENKDFTEEMYKITWDDAVIKDGEIRGQYIVTLKKGSLKKQVTMIPVFEGKDYDAAKTLFDSKVKEYSQKYDQKKELEKKLLQEHDALVKKAEEEMSRVKAEHKNMTDAMREELKLQEQLFSIRSNVMRCFSLTGFGIWNCDNPHLQYSTVLKAVLKKEDGQRVEDLDVCIVNLRYNGMVNNWVPENTPLRTKVAQGDNLAWTISRDKKLLVCDSRSFAAGMKAKTPDGTKELVFKETAVDVKSLVEIKKYLFESASLQ